jgi:protein-S-isoprenylcysteine O-methyltransferase Ste14
MDKGSLKLQFLPQAIATILLAMSGLYAMYSVKRYFGLVRATGADHFDPKYRDMPLVKEGIFRFTSNGMYIYAFLLFWAIGTGFNSTATLIVAAFSHVYVWVHFCATEKPDMDFIYASA